jgi:hypothetical protein
LEYFWETYFFIKSKKLVATFVAHGGGGHAAHAITLYKEENGFYIFKNSYPNEPEIKVPISTLPYTRNVFHLTATNSLK